MKKILLITVTLITTACSSIGHPEYGCKGLPAGSKCMATRDLYKATHGGQITLNGNAEIDFQNKDDSQRDKVIDPDVQEIKGRVPVDPVIESFVTPMLPDKPVPVRTPAQVMRIWVASWEETESGALITPGFIYTEIEPRRWVIGKTESAASSQGKLLKPLE